jgi:glycosyltransferase involved in cell wall biosynthesis
MPQISVITPTFNGEQFIEKCIINVIDQNCPTAEHIIVDGASTDGTVEIIRQYATEYPHIHWISEKDRGQSDAMNKGIAMAKGEIVSFLNVDDYYEPGVLNRVIKIFETLEEPAFLVGNCNVWNDDGNLIEINKPRKLALKDLLLGYYINPFPVNPSAYFYHKSLHDKIGPYDVDIQVAMDVYFLLRAVQVANIKYVDEIWGNFRIIKGTKTTISIESGAEASRLNAIYRKFRPDLPPFQRLQVSFLYWFLNSKLIVPIIYFSRKPAELPIQLKNRINSIFRKSDK